MIIDSIIIIVPLFRPKKQTLKNKKICKAIKMVKLLFYYHYRSIILTQKTNFKTQKNKYIYIYLQSHIKAVNVDLSVFEMLHIYLASFGNPQRHPTINKYLVGNITSCLMAGRGRGGGKHFGSRRQG